MNNVTVAHPLVGHPDFRKIFIAKVISAMGDRFFTIALAWYVVSSSDPLLASRRLGMLLAMNTLPMVCLGPFMGAVADRFDRRLCMVAADAARLVFLSLLTWFMWTETLNLPLLYALVFCISAFAPLFECGITSSLEQLVPREIVGQAAALNGSATQAAGVVGAAFGGVVAAAFGTVGAFFVNAASFGVSLVLVLMVRTAMAPPANVVHKSWTRDVAEAFLWIRRDVFVSSLVSMYAFGNFFLFPLTLFIPLLAKNVIGGGAAWVGWLESSLSAGALIAAFAMSMRPVPKMMRMLTAAFAMVAVFYWGIASLPSPLLTAACFFGCGAGVGVVNASAMALFQDIVPFEMKGRFFALMVSLSFAVSPLSYLFFGFLNGLAPIGASISICAAGASLLALRALIVYKRHGAAVRVREDK